MLPFRQVATVVWAFLGFMVAAALVLNLRYKPIGEGDARYLDTWTGKIHPVEAAAREPLATSAVTHARLRSESGADVILLERLRSRELERGSCRGVRFAFPAEVTEYR